MSDASVDKVLSEAVSLSKRPHEIIALALVEIDQEHEGTSAEDRASLIRMRLMEFGYDIVSFHQFAD